MGSMPMTRQPPEPEIIPPDRARHAQDPWRDRRDPWIGADAYGTRRIYVRRVGPGGIFLLALLIGALAALVFVILLGAFLIWIPIAMLVFVAAVVGSLMRRYLRR
jgi:hypothetical protein